MTATQLLEMRDITKSYPGVQALKQVNLDLRTGEILALIGENGAGKSTLMKVLSGAITADSGEIWLAGQRVQITDPRHARDLGIAMIHQDTAAASKSQHGRLLPRRRRRCQAMCRSIQPERERIEKRCRAT